MWKTLVSLAPLAVVLALAGAQPPPKQPPAEKPVAGSDQKSGGKAEQKSSKADQKASGKSASAAQFGVASESEKLLDQAIAKIEAIKQYRSDVRQVVEMLGYKFVADGQYAVGPDFKMLYELKVQLSDPSTTGTMKEVCDGKVLWKFQQVIDAPSLVRVDVQKLKGVMDNAKFPPEIRADVIKRFGFSGVVPMMRGLRESQKFASHEDGMLDDVPVYVLQGVWQETAINQTTYRGMQLNVANLPPHIPDKSTVWIGQKDGWPHKIRLESTKKGQTAGQSTAALSTPTVITLEFLNPMIDVDLPESLFTFEPPSGLRPEDQTDRLYQGLENAMRGGPERPKAAPLGVGIGATNAPASTQPKGKPASPAATDVPANVPAKK